MNLIFISADQFSQGGPHKPAQDRALLLLDEICREAQAQVVLCSKQACLETEQLNHWFALHGTQHIRIVGVTPKTEANHEGYGVMMYLKHLDQAIGNYVVLDKEGDYFVWQPCVRVHPQHLNREIGYEILRQLNPESTLLAQWEEEFGLGGLLRLVDPPTRKH